MKNNPKTSQQELPSVAIPVLSATLRELPLAETLHDAAAQQCDITDACFSSDYADHIYGTTLEFSSCRFERCTFADWECKRVAFVDCVLDHCDISGLRLENVTFQRVRFSACRLTGTEFLNASLINVTFHECTCDYFALSDSKCTYVVWENCQLRESLWQSVALKASAFRNCDFTAAQIRYMPMTGQDMTTCTLSDIQIDPHDLRGMRVSPVQGLLFCTLLGLEIAD